MASNIAFMMIASQFGPMWINRFDWDAQAQAGVSIELLNDGWRGGNGLGMVVQSLMTLRRKTYGDGVVVIDGGANIGTYTIPWAKFMADWGSIISFEPQKWVFMQLCANVIANNCFNVDPLHAALSISPGKIAVPDIHPLTPTNYGGICLKDKHAKTHDVPTVAIDDLNLPRLDVMKLDLEGMEPEAIKGAAQTIARCKPFIVAEAVNKKGDGVLDRTYAIVEALPKDYAIVSLSVDLLCAPGTPENVQIIEAMMRLAKQLNMAQVA